MIKHERDFKIEYPLDWVYGVKISQLKKDIEELEKLGVTHIAMDHSGSYVEIYAICRRVETDEEFEQRKRIVELRELKQLEKLKSKYGQ